MKIYSICVVQNEGDVIGQCVEWAVRFSEKVWVWDLGSHDDTWEVLQSVASERVRVAHKPEVSYSKQVRPEMLSEVRPEIPDGAWIYRLDADEFVAADPRPVLESADREGAKVVRGWHLNFYPTPEDVQRMDEMGEEAWEAIPLAERLRYYQVGYPHWRFLKIDPSVVWTVMDDRVKLRLAGGGRPRRSGRELLVRHYQHRSPRQVALRYETRQMMRAAGYPGFWYDVDPDFRSYVRQTRKCERWNDADASRAIRMREVLRWRARRSLAAVRRFRFLPPRLRDLLPRGFG